VQRNIFNSLIGYDVVKKRLCDPNFVEGLTKRFDKIEEFFNKKMNIKTERVSPFTFKFEHNTNIEYKTDSD